MRSVFVVQHLHILPCEEENVKMIGVYSSQAEAEAAVSRLRRQPGFASFSRIVLPDDVDRSGFYIDEYEIDKDHWTEGFVTL